MYKVLADGNVIYDDRVPSSSGLYLVRPKLHLEDSAAGSFECDLIPGTFAYSACEGMTSVITVLRDDEEIFEGRILSESYDFNNVRSIYVEGELAYLNDTYQPQAVYHDITIRQLVVNVLCVHNTKVPPSKRFNWDGVTDPSNPESIVNLYVGITDPAGDTGFRYTQYESSLQSINKLLETFGGHLVCKKINGIRSIQIYTDYPGGTPNQRIKYGVNLLDYSKEIDYSKICSVVLPTGGVLVSKGEVKKGGEIDLTTLPHDGYNMPLTHDYQFIADNGFPRLDDESVRSEYSTFYHARVEVEEYKTYYLTCRMRGAHHESGWQGYTGNYGIYSFRRADGPVLQMKTVSLSEQAGFVDTVDLEITAPAGAKYIELSGLDYPEIPMRFYKALEPEEDLDEYVTVESVNDGSLYVVNQALVDRYGWIEKQIQWDDITDPQTLYDTAALYLSADQFNEITYELSAVDMRLLGIDCNAIRVGMKIECEDEHHGLDPNTKFPVTMLDIPLDSPEDMTIQLGYAKTPTLTQANNDLSDDILARIAQLPSESKTLNSAKQNAAALINSATNGYVTIHQSGDGTDEIIISDSPDYLTAENVWRWNINGLIHQSPYGSTQNVTVAITMDGQIVADAITTGQMTANRIRGGELVLGGIDNTNGKFILKNVDIDYSTTPPTYGVWNGITMDRDGFQSFSKGYDYIDQQDVYHDIKIIDGQIKAGSWTEEDGFTEYGHIAMTYYADPGGGQQLMPLIDFNAPILQLNCSHMWITEQQGGAAYATPDNYNISVVTEVACDADGKVIRVDKTRLDFRHGILIGSSNV